MPYPSCLMPFLYVYILIFNFSHVISRSPASCFRTCARWQPTGTGKKAAGRRSNLLFLLFTYPLHNCLRPKTSAISARHPESRFIGIILSACEESDEVTLSEHSESKGLLKYPVAKRLRIFTFFTLISNFLSPIPYPLNPIFPPFFPCYIVSLSIKYFSSL